MKLKIGWRLNMQCLTQNADHFLVLQRDDCLIEHKVIVNLNKTD